MTRYIKVALFFILIGGAGTVYIVLSADGITKFNTKPYEVVLTDATGISTRSQVYMAGVTVGKVEEVNLEGSTARIRFGLLKGIEVRQNASISRKSSSILGTAVLSLDPGSESSPILPAGSEIQTQGGGMDVNAIMGTVSDLGGQVSEILREFQNNQMALLAVSLETFNSISGKIDARMNDELDRISRILESAALITARTERMLANNEGSIDDSMEDIRLAAQNIRQISEDIAGGRGNVGMALYDDRLYNNILSTVGETEKTIVKLQGLIDGASSFVDKANGLGVVVDSHANYGALKNTVRAGASVRLEPASGDRWYRVGVNGAPDGVSSRKTTTSSTGGQTTVTEETQTQYNLFH